MQALEHNVLKTLKSHSVTDKTIVVAVSGGADSVCLLNCLNSIKKSLNLNLIVAYVHHGKSGSEAVCSYRDLAGEFVKSLAAQLNLTFESNTEELLPEEEESSKEKKLSSAFKSQKNKLELKKNCNTEVVNSEAALRNIRYDFFEKLSKKYPQNILALAHHYDDQLENMFIRMIRGSGAQGLQGMRVFDSEKIRPLLMLCKNDILEYLEIKKINSLEDPTNSVNDPLRNWLRNDWLPQLEAKHRGAKENIFKSVSSLVSKTSTINLNDYIKGNKIYHIKFLELPLSDKKMVLAAYMRRLNLKDYGQSHIEEVLKRLDTSKKTHNFRLLKREWQVNPQSISVDSGIK